MLLGDDALRPLSFYQIPAMVWFPADIQLVWHYLRRNCFCQASIDTFVNQHKKLWSSLLIPFVFEYIVRSSAAIFSNKSVMMLVNLPSLEWFTPSVHTYRCSFHPREYITKFSKSIYSHIESLMTHPVPPARSCTVQHCDPIIRPRYLEIVEIQRLNHWKSWADWAGCLKKNSQQKQRKNPHQKPHIFLFLWEPQLEKMIQNVTIYSSDPPWN